MPDTEELDQSLRARAGRALAPVLTNPTAMAVLAVVTLAAIGYLDWATGTQLSVTGLYLIPVAIIAWYIGGTGGRLAALAAGIAQVGADLLDVRVAPSVATVVWNAATIIVLAMVVAEALTRLHSALEAEHELARTDSLSGLPNARSFEEFATLELERARRYHRRFTVACLDLDHFKEINDTRGHAVGDRLIHDVAQALRANLRRVDVVARLGGDEFTMLLPETDAEQALVALGHVRRALSDLTADYGADVKASIGAVTFATAPENIGDMVRLADTAMYRAKAAGRDRIESITLPDDATRLEGFELTAMQTIGASAAPEAAAEAAS
jgi:diguanylate cyclase (GGDEF)-like protein